MSKGVAVINIGGTSHDREKRSIADSILADYRGHIREQAQWALDQGYKSVMIMNPGGYDWGYKDFDEIIEARENFNTAFIPGYYPQIINHLRNNFEEVIIYLGSLHRDPNFLGLTLLEYLTRVRDSLIPFRGARIGIDAMSHFQDFAIDWHGEETTLLTTINSMFGPIILEGKYNERWTPEILLDYTNMWQYEIAPRDGDIITPGSYVLIRPMGGTIDVEEAVKETLDQGHIPCVGV